MSIKTDNDGGSSDKLSINMIKDIDKSLTLNSGQMVAIIFWQILLNI
jgi:hypothetical protein